MLTEILNTKAVKTKLNTKPDKPVAPTLYTLAGLFLGLAILSTGVVLWLGSDTIFTLVQHGLNAWFALDTVQAMWYLTRAAGLTGYLLLWLSMVWGLAVSSKIFHPTLHGAFSYDMHQFISLFSLAFILVHMLVLMADRYLPFSWLHVLVPFTAPYRPLWVGIGVLGWYLTLLVTVTFYLRRWIGQRAFRVIHYLSFFSYLGVTLHGWFAGTDTTLWSVRWMYAGTALAIVFLTVYWLLTLRRSSPAAVTLLSNAQVINTRMNTKLINTAQKT